MANLTKDDLQRIHDTHDAVIAIKQILGDGHEGLCHDVRCHQKRISHIEIAFAFLVGTGFLTGGTIGLVKLIGG